MSKSDPSRTADKARVLQASADERDKAEGESETKRKPVQTGARPYPAPPIPKQHKAKPGLESELDPPPMYDAPYYKGSEKPAGKVAIITGGDSGIGRSFAVLFAREGADIAIIYLEETGDAEVTRGAARCKLRDADACLSPAM